MIFGIVVAVGVLGVFACSFFRDYSDARQKGPERPECEWINLARALALPYWKKAELLAPNYTPEKFESYMYTLPLTSAESAAMYVEGYDVESFTERFLQLSWAG